MKRCLECIDFELTLSCAISLSVNFFPAYPAERCVLNGKVKMMLNGVFAIVCAVWIPRMCISRISPEPC